MERLTATEAVASELVAAAFSPDVVTVWERREAPPSMQCVSCEVISEMEPSGLYREDAMARLGVAAAQLGAQMTPLRRVTLPTRRDGVLISEDFLGLSANVSFGEDLYPVHVFWDADTGALEVWIQTGRFRPNE
ncbi:MAG: hypothetical protein FJW79_12760 [Actinobacteria bacterium]|nr:hypothetical protein [Actinomycetota bacterium]